MRDANKEIYREVTKWAIKNGIDRDTKLLIDRLAGIMQEAQRRAFIDGTEWESNMAIIEMGVEEYEELRSKEVRRRFV